MGYIFDRPVGNEVIVYIPRIQEQNLDRWWADPGRRPLVLRGARQVGKSTLVRNFAATRHLRLAEINLEDHLTALRPAFEDGNLATILTACSRVTGVDLTSGYEQTLLFLDEIQTVPAALKSLRYFYEKLPRLAVIAAGSVLEFALTDAAVSMPVGRVTYLFLPPITFKEFLVASDRSDLTNVITAAHPGLPQSLTHNQHDQLLQLMRRFLIVGGMPQAVTASLTRSTDPNAYASQSRIQSDLLNSYRDDIQKYPATKHIREVVREVFDRSPAQIGVKVKYSRLAPEQPARDVKKALGLLLDAGLLHPVFHSDAQGIPLGATEDRGLLKLYFVDTGLLLNQLGITTQRDLPAEDIQLVNSGVIAEQFVAQELLAASIDEKKPQLHYWLRERKTNNAEVDFVLGCGPHVVPVEVKAGPYGHMKSLWEYCRSHRPTTVVRFDTNLPASIEHVVLTASGPAPTKVLSLPLYMASEARRLISP